MLEKTTTMRRTNNDEQVSVVDEQTDREMPRSDLYLEAYKEFVFVVVVFFDYYDNGEMMRV